MDQDYQNDEFQLQEVVTKKPNPKPLAKTSDDTTGYSVSHLPKVLTKDKELLKKYSAMNLNTKNKLHSLDNKKQGISKSENNKLRSLQPSKRRQMSLFDREKRSEGELKESRKIKLNRAELNVSNKQKKQFMIAKEKEELILKARTQLSQVQWDFYHTREQLQSLSAQKINRLNNRVREWIVRKNHELDLKINEVMRDKSSLTSKVTNQRSQEEVIVLLQSQIISNEKILVLGQKEEASLRERTNDCEEEQYEKSIIEQIALLREKIKEYQRGNIKLKQHTEKYDDKLKLQVHQKPSVKIEELKIEIINEKSESTKNESLLIKLQAKNSEIVENLQRQHNLLESKIQQAKENHIVLTQNTQTEIYKELIDKIERLKTQNFYLESNYSKAMKKGHNEVKLIKNQIKHYDRDRQLVQEKIVKISKESLSLLEQNKDNNKISYAYANFAQALSRYTSSNQKSTIPFETHLKEKNQETLNNASSKLQQQQKSKQEKLIGKSTAEEECSNEFMNREQNEPIARAKETMQVSQQKSSPVMNDKNVVQPSRKDIPPEERNEDSNVNVFPRRFRLGKNQSNSNIPNI